MIADGLYNLLLTTPSIAAIVKDRIYPVQAPEGASYPRLLYWQTSAEFEESLDEEAVEPERASWQIDCQARTYDEVKRLASLVRALFRAHKGSLGTSGKTCQYTKVTNETDVPLSPPDAGGAALYQTSLDIEIVYDPDQNC